MKIKPLIAAAVIALSVGGTVASASVASATDDKCYEQIEVIKYRWHRSYTGPKVIHGFSYINDKWESTPGTNGAVPDSLNPPSNLVSGQTGTFTGSNKPYGLPGTPNQITWSYGAGGEEWWPSQDGYAANLDGAPQGAWGNPVAQKSFTENGAEKPCPSVTFTHASECGAFSVTVTNVGIPAAWWYGVKVAVDGTEVGSAIKQGPGTNTFNGTLAEDQGNGEVAVTYWVHASTEQDLLPADLKPIGTPRSFTVDTDCVENPEPYDETEKRWGAWEYGDPECGDTTNTKTRTNEVYTRSITYALDADWKWVETVGPWVFVKSWEQTKTFDIEPTACPPPPCEYDDQLPADSDKCVPPTTEPPTTEPPVTDPPATTESPVDIPEAPVTTVPTAVVGQPPVPPTTVPTPPVTDPLPATGNNLTGAALALVLLATGIGLIVVARRRSAS